MENRWLLTWLLAPWYSPAAMAIEAYSLKWYRLDADSTMATPDPNHPTVTQTAVEPVRLESRKELPSGGRRSSVSTRRPASAAATQAIVTVVAVMLLAAPAAAQTAAKTLVAVFAHGDDEGPAAPILARYAREGVQVHLIIATDGAEGSAHTSIPRGPELARIRGEEARCAADALGIHGPILLGFPDAHLGTYIEEPSRLFRLTEQVQAELQRLRPDALITWGPDGATGHPDHRLVSSIVTQLVRAGATGVPEHLFYVSIPVEGMRAINPARETPAFLVPLAKYFSVRVAFTPADAEASRRSMSCHRTQYSDEVVQRISELQRRIWNGALSFVPLFATDAGTDLFKSR
jgi:LmbE family N-acetylglucosaminyl deacetylase